MSENETFYDAVIAPELARIATRCREYGMNFVATVEYAPGEVGRTEFSDLTNADPQFRLAAYGARCNGNIDSLITALVKDDEKHIPEGGHTNSVYLKILSRKETR